MFGIVFEGHPNLRRMLLADDWDEGFPLRKDYPLRGWNEFPVYNTERTVGRVRAPAGPDEGSNLMVDTNDAASATVDPDERHATGRQCPTPFIAQDDDQSLGTLTVTEEHLAEPASAELTLNMGPQHPSTHGVLRVVLKLDGEVIADCDPVIGYLHRGTEKLGEHHRYAQVIPWTDRTDYVAAPMNNLGCVLAIEKLCGVEAPGARPILARDHGRAEPDRLPPGLARHPRARHRRALDVALLLPRARADPRLSSRPSAAPA